MVISMIDSYKIDNNILYLYFDFNYEFSKENFNSKKDKIKDIIDKFIKKNNLLLKVATVVLVSGGVVFGTIDVNNFDKNENNIAYVETIKLEDNKIVKQEENTLEQKEIVEETKENTKIEEKNNNTNTIVKAEEIKLANVNNQNNNDEKQEENTNNESAPSNTENVETKEEKIEEDNNIYVNVKRSNGSTIKLELEEYIIGVVGAEMPASFHVEALKAQSIIARTYALKANATGKTLTDNESTQSYKSNDELRNLWGSSYDTYYNKIKNAVNSTKGMYLTYNGAYIEAVYHSTSNGKTESSINVWGNSFPYLVSVDSPYDSSNPSFVMDKTISYEELSNKLGIEVNIDTNIDILGKTSGNRVSEILIGDITLKGIDFRNKLGLRSADFDIEKEENCIKFTTRGYGHGVGLSQYGAAGMAKNGSSFKDILFHYYPGVSINSL